MRRGRKYEKVRKSEKTRSRRKIKKIKGGEVTRKLPILCR